MANYLYPALGGGGGTNTLNFHQYYIDPAALPGSGIYTSYALALAAANAAADTSAQFIVLANLTEDIALPRGMSITGRNQEGVPNVSITGHITSTFASGISTFIDITFIGDGTQAITDAGAASNARFVNCVFDQTADFPILTATAGSNVTFDGCSYISTAGTAEAFRLNGGNTVMSNSSTLGVASGIFANITGVTALTLENTTTVGTINNGGTLDVTGSELDTSTGAVLNHTSGTAARLVNCTISSDVIGVNALQGTGTIDYSHLVFTNTQTGIDDTLSLRPYSYVPEKINTVEDNVATFAAINQPTYIGVTRTTTGAADVNLPSIAGVDGLYYIIKDEGLNASANTITVVPDGAELINGAANATITTNGGSKTIVSRNGAWWIIGST